MTTTGEFFVAMQKTLKLPKDALRSTEELVDDYKKNIRPFLLEVYKQFGSKPSASLMLRDLHNAIELGYEKKKLPLGQIFVLLVKGNAQLTDALWKILEAREDVIRGIVRRHVDDGSHFLNALRNLVGEPSESMTRSIEQRIEEYRRSKNEEERTRDARLEIMLNDLAEEEEQVKEIRARKYEKLGKKKLLTDEEAKIKADLERVMAGQPDKNGMNEYLAYCKDNSLLCGAAQSILEKARQT